MKSTKFKTKTEKGITLIALIITIVVLMILAAVAINSITNDGILGQAGNVANTYNQAAQNEQAYLQDYEDVLTALNGGYKTYEVGETVKVGTEEFYVIEDKTAQGKVVLLAKQNIIADKNNANYLTQSASAGTIVFSKELYWTKSGDIEEETLPIPESHIAAKAAYDYGVKVGGIGRLMTYSEAYTLKNTHSAMIFGTETTGYTDYWTCTADEGDWVFFVLGEPGSLEEFGGISSHPAVKYEGEDVMCADHGVRPVIEISKSKIS